MIDVIPAIDIIGGKCTRLSQGDYATQKDYGGNPLEWARAFAGCGVKRLHLVDLEGARAARPVNLRTLEEIASLGILDIEWGGGIKDDEALRSVWNAGAGRAIIGSIAVKEPERMRGWLHEYPGKIILGADARDGNVAISGWMEDSGSSLESLIGQFLPEGLEESIVTDISRDGMLQGPAFPLYASLQKAFPTLKIIVSGGVSSVDDIYRAQAMGLSGIIIGKAIYEKRIILKDISLCLQNG